MPSTSARVVARPAPGESFEVPGHGMGHDHRRVLLADSGRGVRLRIPRPKARVSRRESGYAGLVHDEYKRLFAFPRMVEDLMRGFAAREWAAAIDFSTLRKLPAEYVSDELRKRIGDTV